MRLSLSLVGALFLVWAGLGAIAATPAVAAFIQISPPPKGPFPLDPELSGANAIAINQEGAGGIPAGTQFVTAIGGGPRLVREQPNNEFVSALSLPEYPKALSINQATGDVFVLGGSRIRVFNPAGMEELAAFGQKAGFTEPIHSTPALFHSPHTVSVAEDGVVYVGDTGLAEAEPIEQSRIMVFEPAIPGDLSTYTYQRQILSSETGPDYFAAFSALDRSGHLYVANAETLYEFDLSSPTNPICEVSESKEGIEAIAVDPISSTMFYDSNRDGEGHEFVCTESGEVLSLGNFQITPRPNGTRSVDGFAINHSLTWAPGRPEAEREPGVLYAAGNEGVHYVFVPEIAKSVSIHSTSVTDVTAHEAALSALLNAEGTSSTYSFQVALESSYIRGTHRQLVSVKASKGTFTLSYLGDETSELPFNASADSVEAALGALPSVGSANVVVSGGPGGGGVATPYVVDFLGELAEGEAQLLQGDGTELVGQKPFVQVETEGFAESVAVPSPSVALGGGSSDRTVTAQIAGLSPDTRYRYRLITHAGEEAVASEARPFRTFAVSSSGSLPDGRVYEMVSPPDKEGGQVLPLNPRVGSCEQCKAGVEVTHFLVQASPDGEAVIYQGSPFGATTGGTQENEYLSVRGSHGWITTPLTPSLQTNGGENGYTAVSSDLTKGLLQQSGPSLAAGAPSEFINLYGQVTSDPSGLTPVLTETLPFHLSPREFHLKYEGSSDDLSRVYFGSNDALTEASPFAPAALLGTSTQNNLYEWSGEGLRLVNVLPGNETTQPGAVLGAPPSVANELGSVDQAVSKNGSNAFWTGRDGQLYERIGGERTELVSSSQRSVEDPVGAQRALFVAADTEGRRAIFSSSQELTDDADTGPIVQALSVKATHGTYKLSFEGDTTAPIAFNASGSTVAADLEGLGTVGPGGVAVEQGVGGVTITHAGPLIENEGLITADGSGLAGTISLSARRSGEDLYEWEGGQVTDLTPGRPGGGFAGILGHSEDLSSIYFVDRSVLTTPSERGPKGEYAESGMSNLYLRKEGTTRFIAQLASSDGPGAGGQGDWSQTPIHRTAQASPGGRYLAFISHRELTAYENSGPCETNHSGGFVSAHCAEVYLYDSVTGQLRCASCDPSEAPPLGPSHLATIAEGLRVSTPQPRYMLDSGRLFFDSQDSLSPSDNNAGSVPGRAVEDVYEFEPEQVGSCQSPEGCVSLISSGQGGVDSNFLATNLSGSDTFFTTRDRLVPSDRDELVDAYDAREGGGIEEAPASKSCTGEACQPAAPPTVGPAATPTAELGSEGPTALTCKKGQIRKNGRCVRRSKRHGHHKAKKKKQPHANSKGARSTHASRRHRSAGGSR